MVLGRMKRQDAGRRRRAIAPASHDCPDQTPARHPVLDTLNAAARCRRTTTVTLLCIAALGPAPALGQSTPQSSARRAPIEVHEATVAQLQAAMADGRTTSAALVDAYLARGSAAITPAG